MTETTSTPSGFKNKSDLHMARKLWHMCGVFAIFVGWILLPYWWAIAILGTVWLLFVTGDVLRQRSSDFNQKLMRAFGPIMRSYEVNRLAGTTYLLTGVLLTAILFNSGVVSLSLLFLAFADPIASFVGIKWGKDKIFGHKSVQGFMAAFFVCTLATYTLLSIKNIYNNALVASLLAGLVGAFAELIPIGKIDDNFTMPVLSALGLTIFFYFFGFFSYFN